MRINVIYVISTATCALMLLIGQQEEYLACKNVLWLSPDVPSLIKFTPDELI